MRILYCISGIFSRGGMERTLINKANYLAEHCYDVIIVTTEQQDREPAYRLDKRIRLYDGSSDISRDSLLKKKNR